MEIEQLHRLIDEKKWTLVLRVLDLKISERSSTEDNESIIWIFENLDVEYRHDHAQRFYSVMWKIAFESGKIKLAKQYVEALLNNLIELKRVPALKKLMTELAEAKFITTHKKFPMLQAILGKKGQFSLEDSSGFEHHPEMWKNSKNILRNFLLEETEWTLEHWKLSYEYILKFYYDKELFLLLAEKSRKLKKDKHSENILAFLREKKVNLKAFEVKAPDKTSANDNDSLNVDYDQLAMDVISGVKEPSITEQKRILVSIQNLDDAELLDKGKDMIVAFGLLGMDKVVVRLCERVIPLVKEVKLRAGIQFMLAQALFNNNEFYKVTDLIDDTFETEPLLPDEVLAFNYLKAESLLKLKKHKQARELFVSIKKHNPHYRLVGDRLRELEDIK
ncbi:CDC27 family protein [Bacteriovorax sp. PP10]|uniref:CDC27 family protein n=1 Tax=Bacteriovorax antarcticus TaxID=3088717 RepID=A0ABU5VQG3_9BACT|nr:CDC27 family protein [Bacteriovorax sp. PP10]MEA9354653.1 CDC27 family protein [Bacteriovorax sp. PP10]